MLDFKLDFLAEDEEDDDDDSESKSEDKVNGEQMVNGNIEKSRNKKIIKAFQGKKHRILSSENCFEINVDNWAKYIDILKSLND